MSRLMSVAYTEDAVVTRVKTVTRRSGWWEDKNGRRLLNEGDRLTLCRKVQGRGPDEPLVRLAEVTVVSVRREPLGLICTEHAENPAYARSEMVKEGFPGMDGAEFVARYFTDAQGIGCGDEVTRIEWRYLDTPDGIHA